MLRTEPINSEEGLPAVESDTQELPAVFKVILQAAGGRAPMLCVEQTEIPDPEEGEGALPPPCTVEAGCQPTNAAEFKENRTCGSRLL